MLKAKAKFQHEVVKINTGWYLALRLYFVKGKWDDRQMSLWKICATNERERTVGKDCCYAGPKKPVEGSGGISNAIYSKNTIVFTMAMKYRFYVYKFSKLLKVKPQSFYRLFTEDFTQKISWKVSWKYAARTFGFYACHAS